MFWPRNTLPIIEDVAQAHGARYRKKRVGTFGKLAAFSFYPTKNLAAMGDAGAVATSDQKLADKIRALRQYGWNDSRQSQAIGLNSRLDELQAAILRIKLRHINQENRRRRKIAQHYDQALSATTLKSLQPQSKTEPVYHQYVVRTPEREQFQRSLEEQKIQTAIHYPVPVHLQPAYQRIYQQLVAEGLVGSLAVTEQLAQEVVSLPMYPQLDDAAIERVCQACRAWNAVEESGQHG
ncbi:MAG: DegT/DnrJ/EryC1/StrS family aminotransferase [Planctomycetaceae bacterium]